MEPALIFVYNADASFVAQAFDFLHKTFAPDTYSCNLCRVTYGVFTARREWTEFIKSLPYRTVFLHRDEFRRLDPELAATLLPAVFAKREGRAITLLVSAQEINRVRSVEEMKALLLSKLAG